MRIGDLIRGITGRDAEEIIRGSRAIRRHPQRDEEPEMRRIPKSGARRRRYLEARARSQRRMVRSSKRGRLEARSSGS